MSANQGYGEATEVTTVPQPTGAVAPNDLWL